jgi:putative aldouronate transport system permease protein
MNELALKKRNPLKTLKKNWPFLLLIAPGALYVVIFSYIPMLGLNIAFRDYFPGDSLYWGDWVGLRWFREFFSSYYIWRLFRNTFMIGLYSLFFGFPVPIIFALALNETKIKYISKPTQVISYLPNFISTVVVVGMIMNFLSPNGGIVNVLLEKLGYGSVNFLADPKYFRTIYVVSGIWQSFGYTAIIYISSITSINPELYEAAIIDGAGRLRLIWHITLPGILPVTMFMLILSCGSILSVGFEKILLLYSPGTYETADVISTFVYRMGLENVRFSFATAVGLFNSVVNISLLALFNFISRKATEVSLW